MDVLAPSIRIDEPGEAVGPAQANYLDSVLREGRGQVGTGFSIRFRYDLEGNSHWDGGTFCLDVQDGRCELRRATASDSGIMTERREEQELRRAGRDKTARPLGLRLIIALEAVFHELDGESLRSSLELFRVDDVMRS